VRGFTFAPARKWRQADEVGSLSSQCCYTNAKILRGPWNDDLFRVLDGFPHLAMTVIRWD
jgi:phage terminase large subunit-like protein